MHRLAAAVTLAAIWVVFMIMGFARVEEVNVNSVFPSGGEDYGFRPEHGVINGQGCTGRAGCSAKTTPPIFDWAKFTSGDGGQIYFEWRGDHGEPIAYLLITWMLLMVIFALVGMVVFRDSYQRRLCLIPRGKPAKLEQRFIVPLSLTWCELVVAVWIVGWLVLCYLYVWNHAYINNLVSPVGCGLGGMLCGILTLLLFPVAKNSVLLFTFGIPYERALRFHTRLGTWTLTTMFLHFLLMMIGYVEYYKYGEPVRSPTTGAFIGYADGVSQSEAVGNAFDRITTWKADYPHGPPLAGLLCFFVQFFISAGAIVRRKHYNFFIMTHMLYAVLYPLAWVHYPTLMIFSGIPVILYAVDVAMENVATMKDPAEIIEVTQLTGGITKLTIAQKNFTYSPGQWVTLRIPSIDNAVPETHPLSVARTHMPGSGPDSRSNVSFTLYCKEQPGKKMEWSSRLQNCHIGDKAIVTGPHGRLMFNEEKARHVFLFAGGVGIVPVLGFMSHYKNLSVTNPSKIDFKYVTIVWAYRGEDVYEAFKEDIEYLSDVHGLRQVAWNMYNTEKKMSDDSNPIEGAFQNNSLRELPVQEPATRKTSNIVFKQGRPDWASYLRQADHAGDGACFVCGPEMVVHSVSIAANTLGVPVHAEEFQF